MSSGRFGFGPALVAICLFAGVGSSLGGPIANGDSEDEEDEGEQWEWSVSTYTYVVRNTHDFVNPNVSIDRGWIHLEARYNYEELKTGSVGLGHNFEFGDKLAFEITPMLIGVFGNLTGVAPAFQASVHWRQLEFSTEGEYFCDAGTSQNNFFYSWSELSAAPLPWLRFGVVAERTNNFGNSSSLRPGPFLGFVSKHAELTAYWISPGAKDSAMVLALTTNF